MRVAKLSSDITIADVLCTLQKPEEYLRVILAHLSECRMRHGSASVRLGTTGTGKLPYHKVAYTDAGGTEQLFCQVESGVSGRNAAVDRGMEKDLANLIVGNAIVFCGTQVQAKFVGTV